MRPDIFVVIPPSTQGTSRLSQRSKDFLIKAFISESGIEAFEKTIFLSLAGINEVPADLVVILPSHHGSAGEFSAVITNNAIRTSIDTNESKEFPGYSLASAGKVRDGQVFSRVQSSFTAKMRS